MAHLAAPAAVNYACCAQDLNDEAAMRQPASDPFVDLPETARPERRLSVRYACEGAMCHLGRALPRGSPRAWVVDVSASGVGLLLKDDIPPGTQLALEFAPVHWVLPARVVHSIGLDSGTWLVGCRFAFSTTTSRPWPRAEQLGTPSSPTSSGNSSTAPAAP